MRSWRRSARPAGGGSSAASANDRGDVAIKGDETPERGLPAVNGLSCDQLQHLRAERIGSAQDDPSRADGALDVGADLSAPVADQVLADEGFIALRGVDEKCRSRPEMMATLRIPVAPLAETCGKGGEFRPLDSPCWRRCAYP